MSIDAVESCRTSVPLNSTSYFNPDAVRILTSTCPSGDFRSKLDCAQAPAPLARIVARSTKIRDINPVGENRIVSLSSWRQKPLVENASKLYRLAKFCQ